MAIHIHYPNLKKERARKSPTARNRHLILWTGLEIFLFVNIMLAGTLLFNNLRKATDRQVPMVQSAVLSSQAPTKKMSVLNKKTNRANDVDAQAKLIKPPNKTENNSIGFDPTESDTIYSELSQISNDGDEPMLINIDFSRFLNLLDGSIALNTHPHQLINQVFNKNESLSNYEKQRIVFAAIDHPNVSVEEKELVINDYIWSIANDDSVAPGSYQEQTIFQMFNELKSLRVSEEAILHTQNYLASKGLEVY